MQDHKTRGGRVQCKITRLEEKEDYALCKITKQEDEEYARYRAVGRKGHINNTIE